MSQGVMHTSGRHSAAPRHYGSPDGGAPHECEFCSPEPRIAPPGPRDAGSRPTVPGGVVDEDVRRWLSAQPEFKEQPWSPES
jgi:hypothetical protein